MTLRARIILIVGGSILGIALIFGIVVLVQNSQKKGQQAATTPTGETAPTENAAPSLTTDTGNGSTAPAPAPAPVAVNVEDSTKTTLTAIALPFIERYGSYSNQNNMENIADLVPFMTKEMQDWAAKTIKEAQSKPLPTIYQGTTTKVVAYTVTKASGANAEITAKTQRIESTGTAANSKTYNQDIIVTLVKEGGVWLVQAAVWQ